MKSLNQKLISAFSGVLVALSLIFLGNRLVIYRAQLAAHDWDFATWMVLFVGTLTYLSGCFLLATAWERLLVKFGEPNTSPRLCRFVYARTAIAKYIPGNVFQVVGRHVLGTRLGLSHTPLTYAAIFEMLGLGSVSCIIALCGFLLLGVNQQALSPTSLLTMFLLTCLLYFTTGKTLPWLAKRAGYSVTGFNPRQIAARIFPILWIYLLFFLLSGLIMFAIVEVTAPVRNSWPLLLYSLVVFSLSWLAGFVTPGAPSGLGVREAVIVLTIGKLIGESNSILAAFLLRVVTISGDLLFFLVGSYFTSPLKDKPASRHEDYHLCDAPTTKAPPKMRG